MSEYLQQVNGFIKSVQIAADLSVVNDYIRYLCGVSSAAADVAAGGWLPSQLSRDT